MMKKPKPIRESITSRSLKWTFSCYKALNKNLKKKKKLICVQIVAEEMKSLEMKLLGGEVWKGYGSVPPLHRHKQTGCSPHRRYAPAVTVL